MNRLTDPHDMACAGTPRNAAGRPGRLAVLLSVSLLAGIMMASAWAQPGPAATDLGAFYRQHCARCHGPDGSAVGADGKKLGGRNLTDPDWLRDTPDEAMVATILEGKFFGFAMPGFSGALTADEARRMVTDIIRKSRPGKEIVPETGSPGGN